jgi:hypothetical protein
VKQQKRIAIITPLIVAVIVTGATTTVRSQNERRAGGKVFKATPGIALPQLDALGSRVLAPGKELTTLTGQYSDERAGQKPAQVLHQLPNMVVLSGFGDAELKFDGNRRPAGLRAQEAALLESFGSDTAEGMLAALNNGAAARLLGRGFKPSSTAAPNYTGPGYDIYEVTAIALGEGGAVRKKFYYFDTDSGLLLSTRYDDLSATPTVRVETRFSEWRRVDGAAYPGRIERYENGRRVFSFVTAAASGGTAVDPSHFR